MDDVTSNGTPSAQKHANTAAGCTGCSTCSCSCGGLTYWAARFWTQYGVQQGHVVF